MRSGFAHWLRLLCHVLGYDTGTCARSVSFQPGVQMGTGNLSGSPDENVSSIPSSWKMECFEFVKPVQNWI